MKTAIIRTILILTALMPTVAGAQQNIISAFDAIRNRSDANIVESHYIKRDPHTGVKIGQSDTYTFTLPKKKMNLVTNVLRAFNDDNAMAYSISSGERSEKGRDVVLAVGDGKSDNVVLTWPESQYIYACFLAPKEEDPDGNYRYAYAMCYDEFDGEITGKLVITYAQTMKRRQDDLQFNSVRELNRAATWAYNKNTKDASEPWIRVFMRYVSAFGYSNVHTRTTNAGYLYEVAGDIKWYNDVTEQDKQTARDILTTLIGDEKNSDPIVQQILKGALENIK